jgi:hypothetical protein
LRHRGLGRHAVTAGGADSRVGDADTVPDVEGAHAEGGHIGAGWPCGPLDMVVSRAGARRLLPTASAERAEVLEILRLLWLPLLS